jgi:hypothetical protein
LFLQEQIKDVIIIIIVTAASACITAPWGHLLHVLQSGAADVCWISGLFDSEAACHMLGSSCQGACTSELAQVLLCLGVCL